MQTPPAPPPCVPLPWGKAIDPRSWRSPSTLLLLAVNILPLFGVLFSGWDLFMLMMLYWMETGIIGFWHILRMAFTAKMAAFFLVPFFLVHFGGFMAGHFFFLWMLFGSAWHARVNGLGDFLAVIVLGSGLWLPLLALFISHGISLYLNVFRLTIPNIWTTVPTTVEKGVAAPAAASMAVKNNLQDIMTAPYQRIVILHVTLILGAMLSVIFRSHWAAFVLLILLKTATDAAAHVRKNSKVPTTS